MWVAFFLAKPMLENLVNNDIGRLFREILELKLVAKLTGIRRIRRLVCIRLLDTAASAFGRVGSVRLL